MSPALWSTEAVWSSCSCFLASHPPWVSCLLFLNFIFFFFLCIQSTKHLQVKKKWIRITDATISVFHQSAIEPSLLRNSLYFYPFLTFSASAPFKYNQVIKLTLLHFNYSMLILFLYLALPISPFPPGLPYLENTFLERYNTIWPFFLLLNLKQLLTFNLFIW